MRRVILFGLSANPPTGLGGHAGLVVWAAQAPLSEWGAPADEIWVLPVYRHAFPAKRQMAPFDHRMAMAQLAFEHLDGLEERVRVLDVERTVYEAAVQADPKAAVGTIDVVDHLERQHPDASFALLLGADTYRDLLDGKWKGSRALLNRVLVLAVPRRGVQATIPVRSDAPTLDAVSSSEVRADVAGMSGVLQPSVRDYIATHGLYAPASK